MMVGRVYHGGHPYAKCSLSKNVNGHVAESTAHSHIKEIEGFARGIRKDRAAIDAALTTEWSNGQLEGGVNKLKTLKRQMYGRAGFDLLRQRTLYAA